MTGLTTDAVLHLIQEVAAEVITPRFRALADGQVMEKKPGDLVTVADREAEVLLTRALTAAHPNALVLGEEAASADPSLLARFAAADHAFTVDPVDGTKNFVNGSPDHAVMVSELHGGLPTRAWLWQPEHRTSWVVERGGGIQRNGEDFPAPERPGPPRGAASSYALRGTRLGDLPPLTLSWVCCGVDYPRLLEGACDYLVYVRGFPWDHVPGSLFVAEAGGIVAHADGAPYRPTEVRHHGLLAAATSETYAAVAPLVAELPFG